MNRGAWCNEDRYEATNQVPGRPGVVEAGVDHEGRVTQEEPRKDTLHKTEGGCEHEISRPSLESAS